MQRMAARALRSFGLALLAISSLSALAFSASEETILKIDTRFGYVVVVKNSEECCQGYIKYADQKIEIGSSGALYASLAGKFQMPEGDVVILAIPSGARGSPDMYYVCLINNSKIINIAPQDFAVPEDGAFKATKQGNEIVFDLGWNNRKRKTAYYRAGVIYVGSNNVQNASTLAKKDCAYVLTTLADCQRICPDDGFMNMSAQRNFNSLEEKPIFKTENFFKLCEASCKGNRSSIPTARRLLCGY